MEEVIPQSGVKRSSSGILPALRNTGTETKKGEGWPITFRHLGKNGYELTLYASNQSGRQKWLELIDNAQQKLRARADFLNTTIITSGFFTSTNKVNCVAPFGKPLTTLASGSRFFFFLRRFFTDLALFLSLSPTHRWRP